MIVADTHVIIWNALKPEKISHNALKSISRANEGDGIVFCEISLWKSRCL